MNRAARQYQESQILTAPKEELLILLLDGAMRFTEQARALMAEHKFDQSCKLYIRAQKIMIELVSSLDEKTLEPELYRNLLSLYYFVYWRLVRANLQHDLALVDEALRILSHLRETWGLAVEKSRKGAPAAAPTAGIDIST